MGQFTASLRLPGDSKALAAIIHLHEGRLQVASGDHVIGDWELGALEISRIPEGFRVAVEGEVLLLDIADRAGFEEETAALNRKRKRFSRTRRPPSSGSSLSSNTAVASKAFAHAVKEKKPTGESGLDRFLERAQERLGGSLPNWVFTRGGLVGILALIVFCVILAELVSNILLIAGVVAVLVGGVTMLDSVIARRVLRHRVTPIQVVITGGTIFVAGLLVGVAADRLWP